MVVFDLACCFNYVSYQLQMAQVIFINSCVPLLKLLLRQQIQPLSKTHLFYQNISQPTKEQESNNLLKFEIYLKNKFLN